MVKLLNSHFARLQKNILFQIGILSGILLGAFCTIGSRIGNWIFELTDGNVTLGLVTMDPYRDFYFFTWVLFLVFFFALFCGFYMGTEYHDGTIRNKIAAGFSRTGIYLSNFIANAVSGCIFYTFYLIVSAVVGSITSGKFQIFSRKEIVVYVLCIYTLMIAFASVFSLVGMLVSNKAFALVICVCIVLVLVMISVKQMGSLQWQEYFDDEWNINGIIYEAGTKNPYYVGGVKRLVSTFFLNFLPGGAVMQFYSFSVLYQYPWIDSLNPYVMFGGAVFFTVVPTVVGVHLFHRKELR